MIYMTKQQVCSILKLITTKKPAGRLALLLLCFISCRPTEDVGLANYFIYNNSDYVLKIDGTFAPGVGKACDSCFAAKHVTMLLGYDSNFGHAPSPDEAVESISIIKNDTLKIMLSAPFGDTVWVSKKGEHPFDVNYIMEVRNEDVQ